MRMFLEGFNANYSFVDEPERKTMPATPIGRLRTNADAVAAAISSDVVDWREGCLSPGCANDGFIKDPS